MKRTLLFFMLIILAILSGCASGVSRTNAPDRTAIPWSPDNPLGSLELVMTESGKESAKDNLKFDPNALKSHVERALFASSLLKANPEEEMPSIVIEVIEVRVRSNFSAVMWGFMAGNDHITGDIVIKDRNEMELDRFEVSVAYALGGLAGGMDSARMGWLYETFAEETIKELTNNISSTSVYVPPQNNSGMKMIKEEPAVNTSISSTDKTSNESIDKEEPAPGETVREPTQPRPEDIFKNGDYVLLEFKNGSTKEITLTHINDRLLAGQYEYAFGHTTPVSYDRRDIKAISYAKEDPNKKNYSPDF